MSTIYQGTVGLVIDIDLGETIAAATGISIKVKKPDGSEMTWTPTISGTQILRYTTIANDLATAGRYVLQPLLTLGGWTGYANPVSLTVLPLYDRAVSA